MKSMYQMIKDGDIVFRPPMEPRDVAMIYEAVKTDPVALPLFIEELTPEEKIALHDYQVELILHNMYGAPELSDQRRFSE